jgi:hypothetical protein
MRQASRGLFLLIAGKRAAGSALFPRDDQGRQLIGHSGESPNDQQKAEGYLSCQYDFRSAILSHPTPGDRHLFGPFDRQRAQLSDPVIGDTGNRPGNRDRGKRYAMFIINAGGDAAQAKACSSSSKE